MKTLLFVPKGFEILEFSALFDVLAWADKEFGYNTKVVTCGFQRHVASTFGVSLAVDVAADKINLDEYSALAIPGGFAEYGYYEDVYSSSFLEIIRAFYNKNKIIASICVGALPVGKSGVLAGKRATTYFQKDGYRQKELAAFGVDVINERIVVDENIITSNCPETALDVAFKLLEMLTDHEKTQNVKNAMGYDKSN
jgi:4-methyl-5(b-hydroxyethyl)-thiazole monophosphate biosynthesis